MSAVVAVTVMHVLLFVLHVCILCESVWGACMGGTRGPGVLSSTGRRRSRSRSCSRSTPRSRPYLVLVIVLKLVKWFSMSYILCC